MLTKAQAAQANHQSNSSKKMNSLPGARLSSSSVLAIDGLWLQRKPDCVCDGACPRCQSTPTIQRQLAISQTGDSYEQEADRLAEQVMRMPAPRRQHDVAVSKPPGALVQRKCTQCENDEEPVQRKPKLSQSTSADHSSPVPQLVHEVLSSNGQPLDAETRVFMESRFGHDFTNVRIHDDSRANRSAREVQALAYAMGDHVVFGAEQYQPRTTAGKELLAHELAHVVQQSKSGAAGRLFRRIDYTRPRFFLTNAINTFLAGGDGALTTPTVNGTPLPDDLNAAGQIIIRAFKLGAGGVSLKTAGDEGICSYEEPVVNISANIRLVEEPVQNKWSGQTPGASHAARNANCRGKGNIPVEATGSRSATTIYENMLANEMEHYNDLTGFAAANLGGLLTLLRGFRDTTAINDEDCQQKFFDSVGQRAVETILRFLRAVSAKVAERDVRPGPHHFIPAVTFANDCSRVTIVVSRSV